MKFLLFILISTYSAVVFSDIRDSARELFMEGQRGKAYELLINGLSSKNSKSQNEKIKKELQSLSSTFISEKGQKYFQQAQTLFYSGDSSYTSKLKKAEEIEPENIELIFTKLWFFLIERKCSKAKSELTKIKKLNIQFKDLSIADYYIRFCEGKVDAECGALNYNTQDSIRKKVFKLVSCRSTNGDTQKRQAYCKLLNIDAPKLPEIDLWCSNHPEKLVMYKKSCKSFEASTNKRALLELYPFLCVEKFSSKVIKD